MSEMLSPAVYLRCSENSTENPWKGLAWRPAMSPSTMNLARRSSRATWRITSGFRYFSAVLATGTSLSKDPRATGDRRAETGAADRSGAGPPAVVLRHLGLADLGDQPTDQRLGRLTLGLRLEV